MTGVARAATAVAAALSTALVSTVLAVEPAVAGPKTGCAAFEPESGFYEAGRVATVLLTVPTNPTCADISVSRISDPEVPSDRCQSFLVIFYPADGSEPTATEPVTACSPGPVVLATDVPDGMPYRVLYQIDYLGQHLSFTVHH